MPEALRRTIACFWKRSSGWCEPSRRDATCRLPLVTGTASSGGFAGGPGVKYSKVFFKSISGDVDLEYALIDGNIVQVHQKATAAKGTVKDIGSAVAIDKFRNYYIFQKLK